MFRCFLYGFGCERAQVLVPALLMLLYLCMRDLSACACESRIHGSEIKVHQIETWRSPEGVRAFVLSLVSCGKRKKHCASTSGMRTDTRTLVRMGSS